MRTNEGRLELQNSTVKKQDDEVLSCKCATFHEKDGMTQRAKSRAIVDDSQALDSNQGTLETPSPLLALKEHVALS